MEYSIFLLATYGNPPASVYFICLLIILLAWGSISGWKSSSTYKITEWFPGGSKEVRYSKSTKINKNAKKHKITKI